MPSHSRQVIAQSISANSDRICAYAVAYQRMRRPDTVDSGAGAPRSLSTTRDHLDHLVQALAVGRPALYEDYVAWRCVRLAGRDLPADGLTLILQSLRDALAVVLPAGMADAPIEYLTAACTQMPKFAEPTKTLIAEEGRHSRLAQAYLAALLAGKRDVASRLVLQAIGAGTTVEDIYVQVLQPCQHEIGRLWQIDAISVAQEHYCTAATQLVMSQLYSYLFSTPRKARSLVATCIAGDLHEIGVRMVSDLFELDGWDTYFVGANAPIDSVIRTVRERRADALAVSMTLTTHIPFVRSLIEEMRATPDCANVAILVGGRPFGVEPELWRDLGADGCASDAIAAVALANRLIVDRGGVANAVALPNVDFASTSGQLPTPEPGALTPRARDADHE